MCLSRVRKIHRANTRTGEGWKIIFISPEGFLPAYLPHKGKPMRYSTWYTCKTDRVYCADRRITSGTGEKYPCGFHIFATESAARKFMSQFIPALHVWVDKQYSPKVVKVRYKGILVEGSQWSFKVVVAKQLLVPKQEFKSVSEPKIKEVES